MKREQTVVEKPAFMTKDGRRNARAEKLRRDKERKTLK